MPSVRILVFSDGHVGEYPEGRVLADCHLNSRLVDTLHVWDWVFQLAVERQVDFVLFGGDRFRPRRPPAWMRDLADQRVRPFIEHQIPLVVIVGNHDQWDIGRRWDTYGGIHVWKNPHDPIWVFNQPGVIQHDNGLQFVCLPYGSSNEDVELLLSKIEPKLYTICLFHDEVKNVSTYEVQHRVYAAGGYSQEYLDNEAFNLVLGGHVHLAQQLLFKHTTAYHIGTPLERIEDGDQGRKGAWVITIDVDRKTHHMEFVESPSPKLCWVSIMYEGQSPSDILEKIDSAITAKTQQTLSKIIPVISITHNTIFPPSTRRDIERYVSQNDRCDAWSIQCRLRERKSVVDTGPAERELNRRHRSLKDECVEWVKQKHPGLIENKNFLHCLYTIFDEESAL